MELVFIILGSLILLSIIFLILRSLKVSGDEQLKTIENEKNSLFEEKTGLKLELDQKKEEIGNLSNQLRQERSEKHNCLGRLEQLDNEIAGLKQAYRDLEQVRDTLNEKVIRYENDQAQKDEKLTNRVIALDAAKSGYDEEKRRILKEDLDRQQAIEGERNRIWNEHEIAVVAKLKEICQKPEIGFNYYENTNLPESFDGSLKPDFLVELFPEQHLIFDAKFSESKISTYFTKQVPETVIKIKKSISKNTIYPTIFFVVPNDLIQSSRKTFAFLEGFSFFMISPESLAPILECYKKITKYEFADQLNPQDRENIVNVLSGYESFIRGQNAANLLIATKSTEVIHSKEILSDEIKSEIDMKIKNIKPLRLRETEMKKLIQSTEEFNQKIQALTSPKAEIQKKDLENIRIPPF